jgi:hypothetical protein
MHRHSTIQQDESLAGGAAQRDRYKIDDTPRISATAAVHFAHRTRKRIASLAVLGIVGWLLAFAVHLHVPDRDTEASPSHAHHACVLCAAFQPGAGAAAEINVLPAQQSPQVDTFVLLPALRQQAFRSYQSRAPPSA